MSYLMARIAGGLVGSWLLGFALGWVFRFFEGVTLELFSNKDD